MANPSSVTAELRGASSKGSGIRPGWLKIGTRVLPEGILSKKLDGWTSPPHTHNNFTVVPARMLCTSEYDSKERLFVIITRVGIFLRRLSVRVWCVTLLTWQRRRCR